MARRGYSKSSFKFIVIGVALMIFIKVFVLGELDKPAPVMDAPPSSAPTAPVSPVTNTEQHSANDISNDNASNNVGAAILPEVPEIPTAIPQVPAARVKNADLAPVLPTPNKPIAHKPDAKPYNPLPPIHNARILPAGERPKIVVIIDDMGGASRATKDITNLPGPLTLAFLPYADDLKEKTAAALNNGHELMIHVPMEPLNPDLDLGAIALHTDMSARQIKRELNDKIFTAFTGYQGINNHMGSRLTQDAAAMKTVMAQLKTRGLYFVDSRTISSSVAGQMAAQAGVAHATRDVFLDHYTDLESVKAALEQLERVALHNGVAVGIGHPKKHTVRALKEWLPTLQAKGFDLVAASEIVKTPDAQIIAAPETLQEIAPAAGEAFTPQQSMPIHGYSLQNGQSVIY